MNVDKYTKGVLTIIAIALTTLCIQNSIKDAVAASGGGVQKVVLCTQDGQKCAYIVDGSMGPALHVGQ
jgi:hypothetical protein